MVGAIVTTGSADGAEAALAAGGVGAPTAVSAPEESKERKTRNAPTRVAATAQRRTRVPLSRAGGGASAPWGRAAAAACSYGAAFLTTGEIRGAGAGH